MRSLQLLSGFFLFLSVLFLALAFVWNNAIALFVSGVFLGAGVMLWPFKQIN